MNPAAAILLSGNMCDARLWSGRGELLRTVLGERSVVWTDADLTRDDSIAAMAARALAATDGPVLAIGFSMGAIVAVEMAVQAPDRVAGLVVSPGCSSIRPSPPEATTDRRCTNVISARFRTASRAGCSSATPKLRPCKCALNFFAFAVKGAARET